MSDLDEFIDVDFRKFPEYVAGFNGDPDESKGPFYEDVEPYLIEEDQIEAYIAKQEEAGNLAAWNLVTRIYDQGSEGSCVANACCQAHEIIQALQFGKDKVIPLSAISVYDYIGGSARSGAMVSDGMARLKDHGALPLDTPENRAIFGDVVRANTGFRRGMPKGSDAVMKQLRIEEVNVIRSRKGLLTALAKQQPVVVGRQGHSICYSGAMRRSGRLVAPYPNSWSLGWGAPLGDHKGGFGFDSMNQIAMSSSWAFTVRSVVVR